MDQTEMVKKGQEAARQQEAARREGPAITPPVDVCETQEGITLYADMPGVAKDKLSVRVEADTLSIEGEITIATSAGMEASHAEVQTPRYRRAFTLSSELDADKVEAEFKHGVLKLRIPKAEHAKPRKINVQVG